MTDVNLRYNLNTIYDNFNISYSLDSKGIYMEDSRIRASYRQMVVDAGNTMVAMNLTVGTWGNVSVRDRETGLIYIKPSGMPYDEITEQDIVVMNSDFEVVWGTRKPSIEYHFHISIMNARDDVNAVIHTHPIYSSAFGVTGQEIPGISEDFVQLVGDKGDQCGVLTSRDTGLGSECCKGSGRQERGTGAEPRDHLCRNRYPHGPQSMPCR